LQEILSFKGNILSVASRYIVCVREAGRMRAWVRAWETSRGRFAGIYWLKMKRSAGREIAFNSCQFVHP